MENKKPDSNYIYTEGATFRGDILDSHADEEMSERRKKRLEEGARKKQLSEAARKRRTRRRLAFLVVFIILCVALALVGKSVVNLFRLQAERREIEAEYEALQLQIEKDEATLEQVNSDEYVEQQARSELRMIKEGEVLYVIRGDGTKVEVDENGEPVEKND